MKRVGNCVAMLVVAFLVASVASPARAEGGLFGLLFGGGQAHEAPASPSALAPPASALTLRNAGKSLHARAHIRKRTRYTTVNGRHMLAVAPLPPQRSSETATANTPPIMSAQEAISSVLHDETLRPGDAYMAEDGLRVFVGFSGSDRSEAVFVDLAQARHIAPDLKARLAAVDTPSRRLIAAAQHSLRHVGHGAARHHRAARAMPPKASPAPTPRLREALLSEHFARPLHTFGDKGPP